MAFYEQNGNALVGYTQAFSRSLACRLLVRSVRVRHLML
jgi:hypothetical protein